MFSASSSSSCSSSSISTPSSMMWSDSDSGEFDDVFLSKQFYLPTAFTSSKQPQRAELDALSLFEMIVSYKFLLPILADFLGVVDWNKLPTLSHTLNGLWRKVVPSMMLISKFKDIPRGHSLVNKTIQVAGQAMSKAMVDRFAGTPLRVELVGKPKVPLSGNQAKMELVLLPKPQNSGRRSQGFENHFADTLVHGSTKVSTLTVVFAGNGPSPEARKPVAKEAKAILVLPKVPYGTFVPGSSFYLARVVENIIVSLRNYDKSVVCILSNNKNTPLGALSQALQTIQQTLQQHALEDRKKSSTGKSRQLQVLVQAALLNSLREQNLQTWGFDDTPEVPPIVWKLPKLLPYYMRFPRDPNPQFQALRKKVSRSGVCNHIRSTQFDLASVKTTSSLRQLEGKMSLVREARVGPTTSSYLPFFVLAYSPEMDLLQSLILRDTYRQDEWSLIVDALLVRQQRGLPPLNLKITCQDMNVISIVEFLLARNLLGKELWFQFRGVSLEPSFFSRDTPPLGVVAPKAVSTNKDFSTTSDQSSSKRRVRKAGKAERVLDSTQEVVGNPKKKRRTQGTQRPASELEPFSDVHFDGYIPHLLYLFKGRSFTRLSIFTKELNNECLWTLLNQNNISVERLKIKRYNGI